MARKAERCWTWSSLIVFLAVFTVLSGTAWAGQIGSNEIADDAIRTRHIADNQINGDHLLFDSVSASEIRTNAVTTAEIKDGTVTAEELGINSVAAQELQPGAVRLSEIGAGVVTVAKLRDGASIAEILDDDGPGSNLNADLFDGLNSNAFSQVGHNHDERYFTEGELQTSDGSAPNVGSAFVHWNILTGVPDGFADGVDDTGGTSNDLSCAGCVNTADLADAEVTIPKLAFDPATQAELDSHKTSADHDGRYFTEAELSTSDGNAPNTGSNRVHWENLTGVPAGFVDGSDDGTGGGAGWSRTGDAGTNPATDFLGTTDNNPFNLRVNNARALRLEPASDGTNQSPNVIGGTADNSVTAGAHSATIGGGGRSTPANAATANAVTDDQGTVGGGAGNRAGDGAGTVSDQPAATVGGGRGNTASGALSTVAGGLANTAGLGSRSTVGGGASNTASGGQATVGGGLGNTATVAQATVGGGNSNIASGVEATVPGGNSNTAAGTRSLAAGHRAKANHDGAFVWADSSNFDFASTALNQFNVRSTGGARLVSGIDGVGTPTSGLELPAGTSGWSTLGSGQPFDVRVNGARGLRIAPATDGTNQSPNVIGGSPDNFVTAGAFAATIAGGGRTSTVDPATANRVTDNGGTVGGGANNQAGDNASAVNSRTFATVAGGSSNTASGSQAAVGGGNSNTASGTRATVSGGFNNTANSPFGESGATVGGGLGNIADAPEATVGGGLSNTANNFNATVSGGQFNTASGGNATVAGGRSNDATGTSNATVGGGRDNVASGSNATVPGGELNTALGIFSFAAGRRAKANHDGAFVWGDSSNFNFASTAQNQFRVRSTGGAQFISAIDPLDGGSDAGVQLAPGGGSWSSLSDRASKTGIEPISGRSVLDKLADVPVSTWSYGAQDPDVRHIGPMAQDFHRAFDVGEDERHITSVDADGVALAAIKGLQSELRAERQRRAELEHRLDRLEAQMAALDGSHGR